MGAMGGKGGKEKPRRPRADNFDMHYVLLVLFPILYLFNPRFAFIALVVGIILLYRSRISTATRAVRKPDADKPMTAWKDPWGTGNDG
jgi:hypothetical protein